MRYRGQNRRENGNSADSQLKKRSLKGHIGTKNIGKYHKSGLFAEKQNGIGSHIARGLRQETQRKAQETEKGGNAAAADRAVRAGQDGRQRLLRSQRRRDSQRDSTPY